MTTTMVTLEEVLAAAGGRRAALAPETSGYLALAIGDATSRLPLCIEDRGVSLTTEGTVLVPRRGDLVAPADAAKALRETLARLLAVSAGSMPGLVSAARPRTERDVDGVVAGIEAALIPVNRGAARRALARLARETLRARGLGKLRVAPKPAAPPVEPAIAAAPPASHEASSASDERRLAAPELESAAVDELAPVEVMHLTGSGIEVLFAASAEPPAIEPSAPALSALADGEPDVVVEAAPPPARASFAEAIDADTIDVELPSFEEPLAAAPEEAVAAPAPIAPVLEAPPEAVHAGPSEVEHAESSETEHATAIDATAVVRMNAAARAFELEEQEDDGSIPPPRETTPTLLGIGDVGVYVAAAIAPPIEAGAADEDELDATTAALPLVRVKQASPSAPLVAAPEPSELLEPAALAQRPATDFDVTVVPGAVDEDEKEISPEPAATSVELEPEEAPAPPLAPPRPAALPLLPRAASPRPPVPARPRGHAELAPSAQSSVDDLLARFNIAGVRGDQRVARALKGYAGIELTAAPPIVWESPPPSASAVPEPPASTSGWESSPPPPSVRSRASRVGVAISAALLALGLAGTGMLWHLRPDLFGGPSIQRVAPARPAPPAPPREPHAAMDGEP